jgi:hypothetical protein
MRYLVLALWLSTDRERPRSVVRCSGPIPSQWRGLQRAAAMTPRAYIGGVLINLALGLS